MHSTHAKRNHKGTAMNLTLEGYRSDPGLRPAVEAAARRDRAKAIGRLILAPLKALFRQPPLRASRMLHRSATG
jgi:hypothetical protein